MDADAKELIERVEKRIEGYIQQTNEKLDLLIDILKQVAVMQNTQSHQAAEIIDINRTIERNKDSSEKAISRAHKRMDEIEADIKSHSGVCETGRETLKVGVSSVKEKHDHAFYYVKGLMAALAVVALGIPALATKYYGDLIKSIEVLQAASEKHGNQITEADRRIDVVVSKQRGDK